MAFWSATLMTFAVYVLTLGPSVGLEDSGELATAAASLGVPHPPGYPFWTFCSWVFCKLFGWVSYMGHPSPAWCVSLCSAVFGALAAGCTAMLICRSARDFIASEDSSVGVLSFAGGVAGALTFALSPVEWSQSTIVEIYSLNALFLMGVFLLSYRWMAKPSNKILWTTAFVFGLGLTNYQVLLFAIVPLALVIAMKNLLLFRDFVLYLIPVALTYQILDIGSLMRANSHMSSDVINKHEALVGKVISSPSTVMLIIGLILIIGSIVGANVLRKRDEKVAEKIVLWGGSLGVITIALTSFLFTSKTIWTVESAEIAPLIDPRVYALITACIAGSVVAAVLAFFRTDHDGVSIFKSTELRVSVALGLMAVVVACLVPHASDAGYRGPTYPWVKSSLIFFIVLGLFISITARMGKGILFAIPVTSLHLAVFVLLYHGAINGLTHPASWWFGWPIAWNFVVLAMVWTILPNGRAVAGAAFFAQLGISFYAYMPIVSDLLNPPMNWGYPRTWKGFVHAIQRGQYEAIGFQIPSWGQIVNYFEDVKVQFTDVLIPFALLPFIVGHKIVRKENRRVFWQWMIPVLVCFLLMSFLLIALANVKGDLQDGFIQKVKFISSHAMLALWIGYGLVFAAVVSLRYYEKIRKVSVRPAYLYALAAVLIAVSFVYPIVDNYCGEYILGVNEVAFKLGGSEQSGHTFGWQFGAYQLNGAKAINEELIADEEPLPDPSYPPELDRFSILFGGTDPGRFVPTYMIYSAHFRPDIYLITQNALADDTYMSVERDLYGDEIWIPSVNDSAEAFNIYVDEVQSGKRQANGDLKIENGRVQVTGALGVMEINGILTKMMHDHDKDRHSFYVEESYVIPWMYPYLSPHGLIMKLNAIEQVYDPKLAAKDRDFWDWYMRRLLKDPMYRRDFAGQKSFSKLRTAIAGLYNKQGRYREGSQAFREAVVLYPASPEASFRYAQESLLPFRKYDIALEMMDYTDRLDPNNRRTRALRKYVYRIREIMDMLGRLEEKRANPHATLTRDETLMLATCYYEIGRIGDAGQIARQLIDSLQNARDLELIAQILIEASIDVDAERCLSKLLRLNSNDSEAWLDLARIQYRMNKRTLATEAFEHAYRLSPEKTAARVQNDDQVYEIYALWYKRRFK